MSHPAARRPSRPPSRSRRGRRGTGRTHPTRRQSPTSGFFPPVASAFMTATCTASTRLIWPAPMASVARRVGEDHGVRLHVRADAPREPQRAPLRFAGRASGRHLQAGSLRHHGVPRRIALPRLRHAAAPASRRESSGLRAGSAGSSPGFRSATTTRMFALAARIGRAVFLHAGRDHRLDERRHQRARRRGVDGAIQPDDAAEGGEAVGVARADVRLVDGRADGRAAGVGVLDDGRCRLGELERDTRGGIEVEQVGERQFLALQHLSGAEAEALVEGVPSRRLMGILAIAQLLDLAQAQRQPRRRRPSGSPIA